MEQRIINVYSFNELSEEAKQKAIDYFRPDHNAWSKENEQSLKAFEALFPVKLTHDFCDICFVSSKDFAEMSGVRLATYIWNNYRKEIYKPKQYWICEGRPNTIGVNSKHRDSKIFITEDGCPFTGYYMDNVILAPLFDFMRKPDINTSFEELMNVCLVAWQKGCEKDFEFQCSDEQVIESIESNEYEFDVNGNQI